MALNTDTVHHHQPIKVFNAEAAFLMNYPQRERALTHSRARCGLVGANDCKYSRNQRLNVPSEARKARNVRPFLVTHPMTDQCCLASAIVRRAH
jgi:hypothetical protein